MDLDVRELKEAFAAAAHLAHIELRPEDIQIELVPAPHRRPKSLPADTQGVYCFLVGAGCLKIGKAGPKTQARFTTQHYGGNAPSTLAKSIIADKRRMLGLVAESHRPDFERLELSSVGAWLETHAARLHLYLPASAPPCALDLAEAFLQCRLRPVYEGRVT